MSKKNKKPAPCTLCETVAMLTEDHIVPKWFINRLENFGISIIIIGNIQKLCQPCNSKKGGVLDYKDPRVKEFMQAFISELQKKIK